MKHDEYNKLIDLFLKEVGKAEKDFIDFLNKDKLGKLIVKIAYILCYNNFDNKTLIEVIETKYLRCKLDAVINKKEAKYKNEQEIYKGLILELWNYIKK